MRRLEQICHSKLAYETKTLANEALKDFQSRPDCHSKKVYYCDICGKFHLSSKVESKFRVKKIDKVVKNLKKAKRI
jgi:hypothetical protein